MNEIDIINNLKKIINNKSALNLSDDVFFDKKNSLVATIDTYNEKIHFLNFKNPKLVIKKVIRSSISDIISKGVDPKYLLVSFSGSKKNFNSTNVKKIVNSIKNEQKKYKFALTGGDTTYSNNTSFTLCVFGFAKKIIKRNCSQKNDDIYITGNIGDSSVGVSLLKNKIKVSGKIKNYFLNKYFKPDIPFGFHKELYKFANSSMDISDGLLIDLKRLIGNQKLGYIIYSNLLPKSKCLKNLITKKKIFEYNHIFNGDDYQILFTAKKKYRNIVIKSSKKWNQKVTMIGSIVNSDNNYLKINNKLKKIVNYRGYIHNFK